MPRQIVTTVYKFDELSAEAKKKAVHEYADINVDSEWWDSTYEDAAQVGITIQAFDIGRGNYCNGKIADVQETATKIIENHGEECSTYKTAKKFTDDYAALVEKYSDGIQKDKVAEGKEEAFDEEAEELEEEFKNSILEDYRIILQKEYDYQTGEEAIISTIEANEYEFLEDGSKA